MASITFENGHTVELADSSLDRLIRVAQFRLAQFQREEGRTLPALDRQAASDAMSLIYARASEAA